MGFPIPFFETCEERYNRGQRYLGLSSYLYMSPRPGDKSPLRCFPTTAHPSVTASLKWWRQDTVPRTSSGPNTSYGRESLQRKQAHDDIKQNKDWLFSASDGLHDPVSAHTSLWTPWAELLGWALSSQPPSASPVSSLLSPPPITTGHYQNEAGEWLLLVDSKIRDKREPLVSWMDQLRTFWLTSKGNSNSPWLERKKTH